MSLRKKAIGIAASQAMKLIVPFLNRTSDDNLIRLTYVLEKVARLDYHKQQIRELRALFEKRHPAIEFARRVLRDTNPTVRKKLFNNLGLNAVYYTIDKRKELEAQGLAAPFLIVISPTMRCNLNCIGCYAGSYRKESDLPFDVFDRVISEAKEMGTYFFTISGGEPFIYEGLLDIFKKHNDASFLVYTNGTLIDEEMAKKLGKLGNVAPAISIEGYENETDYRRGKGVYEKVLKAMDNLKREGVFFGFSATYTSLNYDVISTEEFVDFLIGKGCFFGWYFMYVPVGKSPDTSLMVTPEQRQLVRERIWKMRDTKPIFVADFWNDGHLTSGCMSGGRLYAHINNKGEVEPCVFAHFGVDNVKEKSLFECLNSPFFKAIRRRFPWTDNYFKPCMIVDNPWVLRESVQEGGAHPTHPGADSLFTELKDFLDDYSQKMEEVTHPVMEEYKAWLERKKQKVASGGESRG